MAKDSIRLSEKHGVNPSVLKCPCCGADEGLALNGRLPGDAEAPREMLNVEPCGSCQTKFDGYKELGFVLFGIDPEYDNRVARGDKVPVWPFFREVQVITHDAVEKMFTGLDTSRGAAFISTKTLREMGFPLPETPLKGDPDGAA